MTAVQQLDAYVRLLARRLRFFAASRGTAIATAWAVALTVLLVWFANRYKFADQIVLPLRVLLFVGVGCVIAVALAIPLSRLTRRRVTRVAELRIPDFKQRLLTATELHHTDNPFTELLAEDALRIAREHNRTELVSSRSLYGSLGVAVVSIAMLLWMNTGAPGYWGYGASLLWTGAPHSGQRPLYAIAVQPGNKTVRRGSDQTITAELIGFSTHPVVLHAKYHSALKWEQVPMEAQPNGHGYQLLFAGLSDSLEYYVQAGEAQSKHFRLGVKDLPAVKRIRIAIHFPAVIGLKDVVEDPGGDIRAVEGSQAEISVLTDRPLADGVLVFENGSKVALNRADENWLTARVPIKRDGSYHVAAVDNGEAVRISNDYFIEAKKDEPPSVRILHPGRDPHVTPIEEVPITVDATDDFGIKNLQLRYSVNGGQEQTVPLLKTKDAKEAEGKTTLYFENFKLAPGDLVSFYAIAQDATHTSRSDIVFAQAEPFDFKFRQSQQAGGMGSSAADQGQNISERQKQIIAATWNELKDPHKDHATLAEHARFLSDLERKLGEQAKTLAERMGYRELVGTSSEFEQFSGAMTQASQEMSNAAEQLKPGKWQDALPPEQKALQFLLRAESIFRDIQVAFGQAGNGAMGSNGASRDLARLFDLELDTSKNQYETRESPAPSDLNRQKQMDEALQRLQELAKRQQELAEQQPLKQSFEQRWEQEQLRREAEQLRQQMEQLARESQSQMRPSSSNAQSGTQSTSSGSAQASSGSRGGRQNTEARHDPQQNAQAVREALDALTRAEDEMRKAVSNHDETARARAAAQLAAAEEMLKNMIQAQTGNSLSDLAQSAQQLANDQKDAANRLKQLYGAQGINTTPRDQSPGDSASAAEMPEMKGPGFAYGYRRRFFEQEPDHPATEQEKALAAENQKLAERLDRLQHQVQQQAQTMSGQQPDVSRKLQKALSDAEEKELALRLQKNSEWLARGYGSETWPLEDSITAGLGQFSSQLADARNALNKSNTGTREGDDKLARALAQVQSLREQLERQAQGRQQSGAQRGQGAEQGSQSQQAQRGDLTNNGQLGGGRPTIGGPGTRDAIDELSALRSQLGRNDHLNRYVDNAIGSLRQMYGQKGLLDARIHQNAVASLERLEIELTRRVDQEQAGGARTGAPETASEKYRDAVAAYFRRLSTK